MPQVTAILPTYGHHDLTTQAVLRLREQSAPPAEIIVVDDGSPVRFKAMANVRVLHHEENRGFAAAVNTGWREAKTELVAVLNNDVTLASDWLERLAAVIFSEEVDFACGKLYRPDGLIDGTFDLICRGGLAWRAGGGRADSSLWSTRQRIDLTSFTAVVGRRDGFLLDDSYHSYYEDVEWSLRSSLAGRTGFFDPTATGVHTGSATAGRWSSYSTRQILRNHRRLAYQYLLPDCSHEYRVARMLMRALCLKHGRWPSVPKETVAAKPASPLLRQLLHRSESKLHELQSATGEDQLWRWYFRLAGRLT